MPGTRNAVLFIRRCYPMLIMMTVLSVVTALVATALPAQAVGAGSTTSSVSVAAPQAATALNALNVLTAKQAVVAAAPSGDVTISVELGISYDAGAMQTLIHQVQSENGRLSDTFKRILNEYTLALPAGTAGAEVFTTSQNWQDFDGTLAETPNHGGLSVTIPAAEVQISATEWQNVLAVSVGLATWGIVRSLCVAGMVLALGPALAVAAKTVCASAAGFIGNFVRGWMVQGFDGKLGDANAWAKTVMYALMTAVPGGLWEAGVNKWAENTLPGILSAVGNWIVTKAVPFFSWLGQGFVSGLQTVGSFLRDLAGYIPAAARGASQPTSPSGRACDIYGFKGTPCGAAYGTVRALSSVYLGPLYQVQRASDNAKTDISPLTPGGYADSARQDSFCTNTSCTITKLYDQSYNWNDLTVEGAGGAAGADHAADAAALPVTADGHKVYGVKVTGQVGYRDNTTNGIAVNGQPEGMYMVASGTYVNNGCCFDFGNAETSTNDTGNGHMDTVNLSTTCYFPPCSGSGPWVEADLENGLFMGANGSNLANKGNNSNFVTALLKNNGQTTYALKGGDSTSGGLNTWYDGALPTLGGYKPMQQEGAVVMGTGGDNSNWSIGSFFEGAMTQGYPSDAADNAVQADIVAVHYAGDSSGGSGGGPGGSSGAAAAAAGAAVVHSGYSSVYSVDSANGHLQETYLTRMGAEWSSQDLSAKYGTPVVMPGTQPVSLTHDGYTSVYTVDASNGHLRETYLTGIGAGWATQDLTAKYGAPPTGWTPTAVVHDGYTSVYTVDKSNAHLQETYLPKMGDPWFTQDLSVKYGAPPVQPGTSPVALTHFGYTSVYTVNVNQHLQETYLPKMNDLWSTQDLSTKYGTPPTTVTPTAVVHAGYTSVYTVDSVGQHLQETYLTAIGQAWSTQDLSAKYGTPPVSQGTQPVALFHTGYTSVYTVDQASEHLQETYLTAIGAPWASQDLSANYGTPPTNETPIPLVHYDEGGNLTWTSVYTIDQGSDHLQETYLAAIGKSWSTQDLSVKYGTPPVEETVFATADWSVVHAGYTSVYTVDASNNHLQETFLTAMNQPWATQDLSAKYATPEVMSGAAPVSLTHDGYTSVYTVDSSNGHLQETYLTAIGQPWATQDLSAKYGTPATQSTPTAVFHEGYTSVYTVNASNGHLQETYLSAIGQSWTTQDLSAKYGTAAAAEGTSPSAMVHSGWTSVYTVDGSGHLDETYLPALGEAWRTQDLSAKYGTPTVEAGTSPTVLVHSGFTSVYTINAAGNHLQETYLAAIGNPWSTQDLSAKFGTPAVANGMPPVALHHGGYASVYTVDKSNNHVRETYLPAIGDPWATQDLSAKYGTPAAEWAPSALLHYDTSGGLTFTSLYTINLSNLHLQETYLPAIGANWATQDLSAKYGTPPV